MPTEILMPALSPTMEEGTLAKWLVKEGDAVASGDLLAEIETDKATMEFESIDEGVIGQILVAEGTEGVRVNSPIAVLLADGESSVGIPASPDPTPRTGKEVAVPPSAAAPKPAPTTPASAGGNRLFASPLARRIAASRGIDLHTVTGSGPHGRIVKADVDAAVVTTSETGREIAAPARETARTGPDHDAVARIYENRPYRVIELDGMRKTIAARLGLAKQTIPHFYLRRDIRLDPLLKFRSEINAQLAQRGIKLSVNDFIIKACANALQQVPAANAVWAGDRILQMSASDVAVAVAVEGGLFTPVVQDAATKSLSTISAEMKDLAGRARSRKLAPHEYQGGSFAISNLGMYGIESFDAVINPPHAAILAVGAGVRKAVINGEGNPATATVMTATLSVDHRVIDGVLGAELLEAIIGNLENPIGMLA